jgi:hypothetical protein
MARPKHKPQYMNPTAAYWKEMALAQEAACDRYLFRAADLEIERDALLEELSVANVLIANLRKQLRQRPAAA